MSVLLALLSALTYGVSDFVGGLLSRRSAPWPVAVVGQTSTAVCTAAVAAVGLLPGSATGADLAWALLAGAGSGSGTLFLYRGFATGRMGVVAPVSAVGAAVLPVAAGVVGGERPAVLAWVGITLALPAIWLVASEPAADPAAEPAPARSPGRSPGRCPGETTGGTSGGRRAPAAGLLDGVLAGLGFGLLFAALGQVPDSAGLWPLALTQVVSAICVVALAVALRTAWVPREPTAWRAAWLGPVGLVATGSFLLATQQGYLAVVGVLASLYPGTTVLLAAVLLREHVHRVQALGLLLCAVTVVLLVLG